MANREPFPVKWACGVHEGHEHDALADADRCIDADALRQFLAAVTMGKVGARDRVLVPHFEVIEAEQIRHIVGDGPVKFDAVTVRIVAFFLRDGQRIRVEEAKR